jgi:hypothetical protein
MICDNMQQGQGTHAIAPMLGARKNRYRGCNARPVTGGGRISQRGDSQMAALTFGDSPETAPPRGALLRLLDTLAEWQMRHSHSVISRIQPEAATISSVTQPSSANERSSTSP